jgi:hypothetical protein
MATGAIRVKGLKELTRDFKKISKDLSKEVTRELKDAAEPVRTGAEQLALGQIRNMTPRWAAMRIGVSAAQGRVYMVPQARRAGGSGRANLKGLLLDRAMDPALEQHADEVKDNINDVLGHIFDHNGF